MTASSASHAAAEVDPAAPDARVRMTYLVVLGVVSVIALLSATVLAWHAAATGAASSGIDAIGAAAVGALAALARRA